MNGEAVTFPYKVNENIVFYPIWTYKYDYTNRVYYNLIDSNNNFIKGLTWNTDNYTFDEYSTGVVSLTKGVNYYIVSVDDPNIKYGPYKVNTSSDYKLYFSEDNLWDGNSHIYIAEVTKTFYFTNSKKWTDDIYVYVWNESDGSKMSNWPGEKMKYSYTNDYGEDVYSIEINVSKYTHIIFSHGTYSNGSYSLSSQTVDLVLADYSKNGFYVTEKNSSGKYQIGTWKK